MSRIAIDERQRNLLCYSDLFAGSLIDSMDMAFRKSVLGDVCMNCILEPHFLIRRAATSCEPKAKL